MESFNFPISQVTQLTYMLDAMLAGNKTSSDLEMVFVVALYWSLGAALMDDSREKFDAYLRELSNLPQINDNERDASGCKDQSEPNHYFSAPKLTKNLLIYFHS